MSIEPIHKKSASVNLYSESNLALYELLAGQKDVYYEVYLGFNLSTS